ncbi:hypothetical protein NQ317_009857 [Molorchus minor]|uniref:Uncharacterized protein n=1 Tax=Molorchus minor TaxID=1323400 RepID=A0ABQ9K384_9CUCU|nr:hypothetical protein NQ317_009857 [Molorchus minor]
MLASMSWKQFKFASKVTEADKKNDLKSLNRKLDKHLVLVLNQKVGTDKFYMLPQASWQEGGDFTAGVFLLCQISQRRGYPKKELDFTWLDRQELQTTLPPNYSKSVSQFLIDE